MGMIGDLLGTLGLTSANSSSSRPTRSSGLYNDYDQHSLESLKVGLRHLEKDEQDKVEAALRDERLWGRVVSSQRITQAIQRKYGYQLAKKVQDKVLTRMVNPGLSPEQIKRNLNYARFQNLKHSADTNLAGKDAVRFFGQQGRQEYSSVAKQPGLTRDQARDAYDPSKGFATKRPPQFGA